VEEAHISEAQKERSEETSIVSRRGIERELPGRETSCHQWEMYSIGLAGGRLRKDIEKSSGEIFVEKKGQKRQKRSCVIGITNEEELSQGPGGS